MSEEAKYIGESYVLEDTTVSISQDAYRLNFYAHERCGLTVYKDKGPPYPPEELLEPIHDLDGLKVGDKLLVSDPLGGGYWKITVEEITGDNGYAKGNELMVSLYYDKGFPEHGIAAEWVAQSMGNIGGLAKVDFA